MTTEPSFSFSRIETFLYIILAILILISVGMFLIIQQVDRATKEIKKFCWEEKVMDSIFPNEQQPIIKIQ